MRIALYDGQGGLRLQTAPDPEMVPGGALLRLRACGIAISDIRAYRAKLFPKLYHKLAGELVQLSPEASGIEAGTRVYINSHYHCEQCSACRRGFTNLCEKTTYFYNQALSEYIALPPRFLQRGVTTKVGKDVSFQDATYVGPLSNCLNTLRAVDFTPGDSVVVLGAGPMGLLHVLLLRLRGAGKIIVSDVDDFRVQKAKESGADYTINAKTVDAVAEVRRLSDGGADVAVVATGRPDAMLDSIKMVGCRGRISFFGGTALEQQDTGFKLDPNPIHYKELKIAGTYGALPDDYKHAAELITSKRISPSQLDTHHFDFDRIQEALAAEKDPKALRVMIRV
jgi:L-iditol 2-dehydrogenase